MDFNFKLIGSTRTTSHMGSRCALHVERAREVNPYTFISALTSKEDLSPKDILSLTIFYEDGKQFGPQIVLGFKDKDKEGGYIFQHPSLKESHRWAMRFAKIG